MLRLRGSEADCTSTCDALVDALPRAKLRLEHAHISCAAAGACGAKVAEGGSLEERYPLPPKATVQPLLVDGAAPHGCARVSLELNGTASLEALSGGDVLVSEGEALQRVATTHTAAHPTQYTSLHGAGPSPPDTPTDSDSLRRTFDRAAVALLGLVARLRLRGLAVSVLDVVLHPKPLAKAATETASEAACLMRLRVALALRGRSTSGAGHDTIEQAQRANVEEWTAAFKGALGHHSLR